MHKRRPLRLPRTTASLLVCLGLLLAACTRSASTAVVPTQSPAGTDVILIPDGQDATMAAIGTEVASQLTATAIAINGGEQPTAIILPTETPPPPVGGDATATPPPVFQATNPPLPGATSTALPPAGSTCPNPYTVQQGDWIYQIARNCNVAVSALIAANPGINPNQIKPGQLLNMPGAGATPVPSGGGGVPQATCTGTHTVVSGDTLYRLAYPCGLTVEQLAAANGIVFPYTIYPGQVIRYS
ncbi:MAG TPA: LysM peptidoglycan-binding domain-containing protein [Chloroflexia bacterium]|nr:LysM peptidoglycan-binding domain-containing protein [Chloroflexia bacterium]